MKRKALSLVVALALGIPSASQAAEGAAVKQRIGGAAKDEDDAARRYFTDTELVDQHGVPRRFYSDLIRGRKVLINFAFTSCKGVCPTMAANLARVQKLLGRRVGAEVTILTITVDPINDTPAALKRYAAQLKAGSGWFFLTGSPENVNAVLKRLGGQARKPDEHTSMLLIGDAAKGVWLKTSAVDKPDAIVELVNQLDEER